MPLSVGGCTLAVASASITFKTESGADSFKIDLKSIDNVLYSDYNSMFEILNNNDIQIRVKTV